MGLMLKNVAKMGNNKKICKIFSLKREKNIFMSSKGPLFAKSERQKSPSCSRAINFLDELLVSHFLYRVLEGKKTTRSQFSAPGLREIHRNLKQDFFFNSRESFFRKSPFCTFSCINPGFGGPWDKL